MPTKQEKSFIEAITRYDMLELAKDWIAENLNPEDVFSTTQLDKWAESEGYVKQYENE